MNLPNKLTLSRFVLTAMMLTVIFLQARFNETIALVLFSLASLTDYFDGRLARREKQVTSFGVLMDPLADKILTCTAFIAFVGRGWVPAWMAVVIVAREFIVTGLRLLAASKNVVLAAERFGKDKTISQIVAIIALLLANCYVEWGAWAVTIFGYWSWVAKIAELAKWVAVFLTATSGALYLWRNRALYQEDL